MAQNKINLPGGFGGIVRYDEEYESRFIITPTQVVAFIAILIIFILVLKLFWPIA
ncbi:preprotein translocase subunit Sec61beta [Candidatus Pacearchaeota archaeon]|nr:preprotein translocase subunit Sec61beta [Candidatus Pacearchaeota archaeon]